MCKFLPLYFEEDGYVLRCSMCNYYQIAFESTILTISQPDFELLCDIVKTKCNENLHSNTLGIRCILVPTPHNGVYLFLSINSANRLYEILDLADSEARAQYMISLFNKF